MRSSQAPETQAAISWLSVAGRSKLWVCSSPTSRSSPTHFSFRRPIPRASSFRPRFLRSWTRASCPRRPTRAAMRRPGTISRRHFHPRNTPHSRQRNGSNHRCIISISRACALPLGRIGALIGFYRWLADRPGMSTKEGPRFFAAPLLETRQRPRLLWTVHLLYFGIVITASVLIYEQPAVQAVLLGKVGEALSARSGPLAAAGKAYLTGNIAWAALVTFLINFFLGSLAYITIPSVILFGFGLVLSWLRALLWGLLLAPTIVTLAYSMLPHSGTMLLEGEGYILAAFFGCLIPIHTVSSRLGGNPLSRWGRVLLLNFTASFWIAIVLAVAAIYEATEVIWMMR